MAIQAQTWTSPRRMLAEVTLGHTHHTDEPRLKPCCSCSGCCTHTMGFGPKPRWGPPWSQQCCWDECSQANDWMVRLCLPAQLHHVVQPAAALQCTLYTVHVYCTQIINLFYFYSSLLHKNCSKTPAWFVQQFSVYPFLIFRRSPWQESFYEFTPWRGPRPPPSCRCHWATWPADWRRRSYVSWCH